MHRAVIVQLGLMCKNRCMCYVNSVELTNGADAEDRDVIWCLRASPDMGHEIAEILSVGSPSDAENGSNLFGQVYSQLHGQTLRMKFCWYICEL